MHSWELTTEEAVELQKKLRDQIKLEPLQKPVELVGGTDISFNLYDDTVYAGIVILNINDLKMAKKYGKKIIKINI